jgi:hypothetical protein
MQMFKLRLHVIATALDPAYKFRFFDENLHGQFRDWLLFEAENVALSEIQNIYIKMSKII